MLTESWNDENVTKNESAHESNGKRKMDTNQFVMLFFEQILIRIDELCKSISVHFGIDIFYFFIRMQTN